MAKNEAKVKFLADTEQFRSEISKSHEELSVLRAEFKLNQEQAKTNGESIEYLQNQQANLKNQLKQTQNVTANLINKYEKAKELYGENSSEAHKYQIQVINSQKAEEQLKNAIDKCNNKLEEQNQTEKQANIATSRLNYTISEQTKELEKLKKVYIENTLQTTKSQKQTKDLEKEIKNLSEEIAKNRKKFEEAEKQADKFDKTIDQTDKSTNELSKDIDNNLNESLKKIESTIASVFTISKIVEFGEQVVEKGYEFAKVSAEVSAEQSAYEQIMGDYAEEATKKLDIVADKTGITSGRLTSSMTSLTAKFKGLGYGIENATNLAQRGLSLSADASAFWDISLEDSISHLNSFINGSYEGGEAIGIFANDTQLALYAVKNGIVAETKEWSNLEEATKQATRLEFAENMIQTSGAVGQARKEASQYANIQANLNEQWRQFQATIGQPILEQVVVPVMKKVSDLIEENSDGVSELVEKNLPKIVSKAKEVATTINNTTQFFIEHGDTLKSVSELVLSTIATYKTYQIATKGAETAVLAWSTAQKILNGTIALNPVGVFVGSITALVSITMLLREHVDNADKSFEQISERMNQANEKCSELQKSFENATVDIGDWSNYTNKAGETVNDLKNEMADAQSKITDIWAKSFTENRSLRDEEIADIQKYNQDYMEALAELETLSAQILKAQSDVLKWKLDNMDLTEEEIQGVLNKLEEIEQNYTDTMEQIVSDQIVILENQLQNGMVTQQEYEAQKQAFLSNLKGYSNQEKNITEGVTTTALQAQEDILAIDSEYYKKRNNSNQHYLNEKSRLMTIEYNSIQERTAAFYKLNSEVKTNAEIAMDDMKFLTEKSMQEDNVRFFNYLGNVRENGQQISLENQQIAQLILNAYSTLPDKLKDEGRETLQLLAQGLTDGKDELSNTSAMTFEEIIKAMQSVIDKSYSTGQNVSVGLANGILSYGDRIRQAASELTTIIDSTTRHNLDIHSPSKISTRYGQYWDLGLIEGIKSKNDEIKKTIKMQNDIIKNGYNANAISPNIVTDLRANLQANLSGTIEREYQLSGAAELVNAIKDISNRPIMLNVNGRQLATVTANDIDIVNGNRLALINRGLSL